MSKHLEISPARPVLEGTSRNSSANVSQMEKATTAHVESTGRRRGNAALEEQALMAGERTEKVNSFLSILPPNCLIIFEAGRYRMQRAMWEKKLTGS